MWYLLLKTALSVNISELFDLGLFCVATAESFYKSNIAYEKSKIDFNKTSTTQSKVNNTMNGMFHKI